jgi:flavin-dependent dehydrogenase
VYLVGDAAGQLKNSTVGGTVTGLWGARAAAQSLNGGRSYRKEIRSLNRELDIHWLIRRLLHRMDNEGYNRLVDAIQEPVLRFLGQNDRDEMAFQFWKLIFLQPKFIPLGIELLFRRK